MSSARKSNYTPRALFSFFFSIFFSPHSVCLDCLAIIVLHCPCHLPTSAWNYATCGAQIGELTSNLARWRYQLWFWDCLWNLPPWCRFSSLGLTTAIRKFITQYLSYSLHFTKAALPSKSISLSPHEQFHIKPGVKIKALPRAVEGRKRRCSHVS